MEQRLIDANAEAEWAAENIPEPHSSVVIQFLRDCGTIDTETLPIVHELRAELARVTADRDFAVELLKRVNDETGNCYGCKCFDDKKRVCTDKEKKVLCDCATNNMWEWRGLE